MCPVAFHEFSKLCHRSYLQFRLRDLEHLIMMPTIGARGWGPPGPAWVGSKHALGMMPIRLGSLAAAAGPNQSQIARPSWPGLDDILDSISWGPEGLDSPGRTPPGHTSPDPTLNHLVIGVSREETRSSS